MRINMLALVAIVAVATIIVLGSWAGMAIYRRYTGLTRGQSALLWLLAAILPTLYLFVVTQLYPHELSAPIRSLFSIVPLSVLSFPFAVRLYRKWVGGWLTDAEKLPDMDGVRAWLAPGNLICAILIPVLAWLAFQFSLPAMFALTMGLVLAYPVFNMASAVPRPAPVEDLSAEREKVLRLLENGRITADESAELLNALGQSVPHRPSSASDMKMSAQRKMVLLGAALLLIGFFLPWFKINLGEAMNEAASQMNQMANSMMPASGMPQVSFPQGSSMIQVVQAGGIPHGLGWWILALGIGAALLPFLATNLTPPTQKKTILLALAAGAFLLAYLLSDTLRYASVGIILALIGYALEFVGTLKEHPAAR